ncbi:MAG: hypothetical protein EOO96_03970 [Pedobacter sp.]|nr:MAG: hypothetical protein EOO96_03970 [Pedobacter sp.]
MKNILFIALTAFITIFGACEEKNVNEKNYYAEAGITTPKVRNKAMNEHIESFAPLYNSLGLAASAKYNGALPELSKSFSDWILKTIDLQQNLTADEQKQVDKYLEDINAAWNKQKEMLF